MEISFGVEQEHFLFRNNHPPSLEDIQVLLRHWIQEGATPGAVFPMEI